MNNRKFAPNARLRTRRRLQAKTFAILVGACCYGIGGFSTAAAQSTSGRIFGHGPAGATVVASGSSGAKRHVTIKDDGRYTIRSLPLGNYTISLRKEGTNVDTRHNIPLSAGGGAEVDFACPQDQCAKAK